MVCGCNSTIKRRVQSEYIRHLATGISIPWIMAGDVNNILDFEDRVGENLISVEDILRIIWR